MQGNVSARAALLAVLAFGLTGCQLPVTGDWRLGDGPGGNRTAAAGQSAHDDGQVPTAGEAEAACVALGRERGLDVQSVLGSRVQRDADEQPIARDVMLRVARDRQVYDLRCNYHYASGTARIMSL